MPWLRVGDSAATHPVVLAGATVQGADSRTRVELLGFAVLLATMSAAHLTDYVVEAGTVELAGGPEADRLTRQAVEAGYLEPIEVEGRRAWRLVDDPELLHIRLREEVEWERRRKRDTSRSDVTVEVVRRDGSACRYCGAVVLWGDKRGGRGATYDHLDPGGTVRSPDDLVVACRRCNSSRGAAYRDGRLAEWDAATPRLPPPDKPYYCTHARARLERHGVSVDATGVDPGGRRAASAGSDRSPDPGGRRAASAGSTGAADDPGGGRRPAASAGSSAGPRRRRR